MKIHQGFTLIEIMIALVIFALLASMTTALLSHAFHTRERIARVADELSTVQLAVSLLKRDTEQAIPRAILGNEMHSFPPFIGQTNYLEFTRDGFLNPEAIETRSTLARVAYLCKGHQFIRRYWERVDTPTREHYSDKVLLDQLSTCAFAYVTNTKQMVPEWQEAPSEPNQKKVALPIAVQVTLTRPSFGNMSLLFIFPVALYD